MGEEQIFRPEEADATRSDLSGRLGVGDVVDVGKKLDLGTIGTDGGLVAVQDKPIFQVEKLALASSGKRRSSRRWGGG